MNYAKHIILSGRISSIRNLGGIIFLTIENGTETHSITCRKDSMSLQDFEKLSAINNGYFIECSYVKKNDELLCTAITDIKKSDYKINPALNTIRLYDKLLTILRSVLHESGFMEMSLPSIHYGKSKSDTFDIDFFGEESRLSSSNALHLTTAAASFGKVYSISRCFRAEPSKTSRHLSEFDLLEIAFIGDDFSELLGFTETLVGRIFDQLGMEDQLTEIKRVSYQSLNESYSLKNKGLGKFERIVSENGPVLVTYFPKNIATWSALSADDNKTYSFNLLAPEIGEIAEGCIRLVGNNILKNKIEALGLEKQLGWYLEMNPFNEICISGMGIGIERLAMWLFGIDNIRKIKLFYRDKKFSEIEN